MLQQRMSILEATLASKVDKLEFQKFEEWFEAELNGRVAKVVATVAEEREQLEERLSSLEKSMKESKTGNGPTNVDTEETILKVVDNAVSAKLRSDKEEDEEKAKRKTSVIIFGVAES